MRCVPPGDRPTPEEQSACLPYLVRELRALPNLRVILALGHIAFRAALLTLSEMGPERVRGKFLHGEIYRFGASLPTMVASYHPSPRNTNTGRLTKDSFLEVLLRLREELGLDRAGR